MKKTTSEQAPLSLADQWSDYNGPIQNHGEWLAKGFSPEEAKAWGLKQPGVTPAEAREHENWKAIWESQNHPFSNPLVACFFIALVLAAFVALAYVLLQLIGVALTVLTVAGLLCITLGIVFVEAHRSSPEQEETVADFPSAEGEMS